MRVTMNAMTRNILINLQKQAEGMLQAQTKIASEKRINKPSDDPAGLAQVLDYRSTLKVIDHYQDNIGQGKMRIEQTDLTLEVVDDFLQQAISIAEEYVNPNHSATDRQVTADRLKDIYDQILQMANSRFGDSYIFSGHRTDTPPYARDADYLISAYQGDDGTARIIIGDNAEVDLDADGRNIFGADGNNIFDQLKTLIDGLEDPDAAAGAAAVQTTIAPLSTARSEVIDKRGEYILKLYRLDSAENYWLNFNNKIQTALADKELADIPEAIMELNTWELAYQSTLQTAAKIVQPTLLNFL